MENLFFQLSLTLCLIDKKLTLSLMPDSFAICKLSPDSAIPSWVVDGEFFSITKTPDELSIVCNEKIVPPGVAAEREWAAFKIDGPLDFAMTGILSSIASPLADARISVFVISTYDTDYILVKRENVEKVFKALSNFHITGG